jgi:hypothetical protein
MEYSSPERAGSGSSQEYFEPPGRTCTLSKMYTVYSVIIIIFITNQYLADDTHFNVNVEECNKLPQDVAKEETSSRYIISREEKTHDVFLTG